jgi:dihydrofolate synthase/folylpolyglutamate synthase
LLDQDGLLLPDGTRCTLRPRLAGDHQRYNAAVAAGVLYAGRHAVPISNAQIEEGVATAEWPGRMELVSHRGTSVLLDGAHNVDGVRVLLAGLEALAVRGPKVLLFGALADKAFEPMLRLLAPHFDRCVFLAPEGRPAAPLAELSAIAPGEHAQDAAQALALATRDGAFVVAAGSIYMIGALRAELFGLKRDPVLGL